MGEPIEWSLTGQCGELSARTWAHPDPRWLAVLSHGYGEHIGRYGHVAETLSQSSAVVVGHDHMGHGHSTGERVLITDFERVVDDQRAVLQQAQDGYPDLPTVLIGHSVGGMIAARYAQRHREDLTALVLSGPVLGYWQALDMLAYDEIPEIPIDPATLSRDPSVGEAYNADPLVWHGAFKRPTLEALDACLKTINDGPPLGDDLPVLWLHGDDDELVPLEETRAGMDHIRGLGFTERIYPGARHEVLNEKNSAEVLGEVAEFVRRALARRP